jgi:hypothetical protein
LLNLSICLINEEKRAHELASKIEYLTQIYSSFTKQILLSTICKLNLLPIQEDKKKQTKIENEENYLP